MPADAQSGLLSGDNGLASVQQDAMSVALRPVQPDDQAFLLELYAATRLDELQLVDWNEDQKQAFTKMQFNVRQLQYRHRYPLADDSIILQSSQPIGRMLVDRNEREMVLVDIALLPEHRNAGIGTRLVQSLLDEAVRTGKSIRLSVVTTNPAVRLYQRLGFSTADDNGSYLEMNWVG
jgi:ribosomal protein S18 acetylase RimI-like enzyme